MVLVERKNLWRIASILQKVSFLPFIVQRTIDSRSMGKKVACLVTTNSKLVTKLSKIARPAWLRNHRCHREFFSLCLYVASLIPACINSSYLTGRLIRVSHADQAHPFSYYPMSSYEKYARVSTYFSTVWAVEKKAFTFTFNGIAWDRVFCLFFARHLLIVDN